MGKVMFRLLAKMNDVFRHTVFCNFLITSQKREQRSGVINKISLPLCEGVLERFLDIYLSAFWTQGNTLFAIDADNNGLLYNDSLDEKGRVPSPLKISECTSIGNYVVVFQGKIKEREFGIYSLTDKKTLWLSTTVKSLEFIEDKLFGQSIFELYRCDVLKGNKLWQYDLKSIYPILSEKNGIIHFLGIHKNLLICGIDSIDKLLAFDINDGKLIWERTTLPSYYQYDTQKEVLHVITAAYKRIDPNTGEEIDSFINRDYFDEIGIFSQRGNYAIAGDHLITTDHSKGIIGAFNTVTHKFDWVYKVDGINFPGANPIIYCEPYLFVHDNKGTLHIFEKEL